MTGQRSRPRTGFSKFVLKQNVSDDPSDFSIVSTSTSFQVVSHPFLQDNNSIGIVEQTKLKEPKTPAPKGWKGKWLPIPACKVSG
jgi:hypothetical protein